VGVIEMQIAASDIMEKMIKKLRKSQGDLATGSTDKEGMKATLISIKVYCDLLLEELDEKGTVTESDVLTMLEKQSAKEDDPLKKRKSKVVPYDDDDDVNGDSIFDF
jgi:hypothetical protein